MRLIDADALMNDFRAYMSKRHDRERCVSEENCKACVPGCLWRGKIFATPTIDPETLRPRAHWIINGDWGECSSCHEASKLSVMEHKDYCPACGAHMIEEVITDGR